MAFTHLWIWLLLPALALLVAWSARRSYAQLPPRIRWISAGVRAVLLVCLVAALSQPMLERTVRRGHLVVLLDASQSVSADNLEAALDHADALLQTALARPGVRATIIAFGEAPALLEREASSWGGWPEPLRDKILHRDVLPGLYESRTRLVNDGAPAGEFDELRRRIDELERFRDDVVGDETDLGAAARLALNCGAGSAARHVVVLTDGRFTRGDWSSAAAAADRADARLELVALDRPRPPEIAAAGLAVPASVRVNEAFSARATIAATAPGPAEVVLYKDGVEAHRRRVELDAGRTDLEIPGLYFFDKGFHTLEVAVRAAPEADAQLRNNTARAQVVVPGPARVLYIEADERQAPYLKSALELEGVSVEVRPTVGAPDDLGDLLSFDVLILSNVPADNLTNRQMRLVRSYVQDFGGGFIMLGGDQSFGLGGYYNTPIEEVLPVRVPIQRDLNRPTLAIQLVIDKSGSMDGPKIQLAKRAAVETARVINPRDLIGVVGFDSQARVVLELTPAGDQQTVVGRIGALTAGGGTFLQPAMNIAHRQLLESGARRRHVIVLSDGQTQGFGYENLAAQMAADGISVSTVGVGQDADAPLLEAVAMAGGGRSYFTTDFNNLPQIFTREALRASRSMLREGLFEPLAVADDPALEGLYADELPLLTGFVATTPRPQASTPIIADTGEPILARWRSGLGRAAAFTSEPKPRWGEDWIQWPDFARFWSQLVRSVAGEDLGRTFGVEVSHRPTEDGVVLTADVRDAEGDFIKGVRVALTRLDESGAAVPIDVEQTAPSLFAAAVPAPERAADAQRFAWRVSRASSTGADPEEVVTPYALISSYPAEFNALTPNTALFDELAAAGRPTSSVDGDVASVEPEPRPIRQPIWPVFLITALLLAPLDILLRRAF